jgi:hypothetical protein
MTPPLLLVSAKDLGIWWPMISERVEKLAKSQDWNAADVVRLIANGDAELWATSGAECFVVVTVNATPWGRSLFVWIGCNAGSGSTPAAFVPQVQAIARHHNCEKFEWESDRAAWRGGVPGARMRYLFTMEA